MVYYLNELSIQSPCTTTQEQARVLIEQFIEVCRKLKKMGYDQLRYAISLKGICLSNDYFIESWLKDQDVEREIRDRFRGITNQTPFFDDEDEEVLAHQAKYTYDYLQKPALGLGLAHFKETLGVSFITNEDWNKISITLKQWDLENESIYATQVCHVAIPEHIDLIKKIFEFNPKHGKCGFGSHTNQSIMYCCSEEEAEILLNIALKHPNKERWFCNYDNRNNRFVVFLPHEEEQKKYHGFHYENTSNIDPDRDLNNPQNGISREMQEKLKKRMSL